MVLADGAEERRRYFARAHALNGDRYALLGFVEDGAPGNLPRDAKALTAWRAEL